ncbi:MAG TPA: hypothetical protein VE127_01435, partial [Solirubrobacteraceae bacterium]|nr:hypothetical protein [Solirubrobacteraceae bacterium]
MRELLIRRRWLAAGVVILVAGAAAAGVVAASGAQPATSATQEPPPSTARVEKGPLADVVSQGGILTYRAGPDGSPYAVINQVGGTYTALPRSGDRVGCGDVLYRVNNKPVLLLCGPTPAYRSLSQGDSGPDVRELNTNLVRLGYASRAQLDPSSASFSAETATALQKLQGKLGEKQSGSLRLGQAVFLPERVRIASVSGVLGATARPGARVMNATSDRLEVQLALDPSQQGQVKPGDTARITLPDNRSVTGKVDGLGRVAQAPAGQNGSAAAATIPAYISLDHPSQAHGLDQAPVQVEITTRGVKSALSVPVT